jgi:hypothetical protein
MNPWCYDLSVSLCQQVSVGCHITLFVFLSTVSAQERTERLELSREIGFYATQSGAQQRQDILSSITKQQAVATVDSEAGKYVIALGNRLAANLPAAQSYRFAFILYDDDQNLDVPWYGSLRYSKLRSRINVLPGAIELVPLSLFDVTESESEFAAAMARGIAHVVLRHFERMSQDRTFVVPIPPAGKEMRAPWFTEGLLFTRSFEREADGVTVTILANAGFNPAALINYIRNDDASFDTSESRVQPIEAIVSKLPPQIYNPLKSAEFEALRARLKQRSR